MIEAKANLEAQNNESMTALTWASFNGQEPCVRLLVENGARKDVKSKFGDALSLAQRNGHAAICKLLEA